jgi:hypothetical protein
MCNTPNIKIKKNNIMTSLERISGAVGSQLVTGTTTVTRVFSALSINADAVIAEIYYDNDLVTNQVTALGINAQTLSAGSIMFCKNDVQFGKIKLTSGSVFIH